MEALREYVREVLDEARSVTVYSPLNSDLEQALYWLKNNKAIKKRGAITKRGDVYVATVQPKSSKKAVKQLVSDRFGHFVKVK